MSATLSEADRRTIARAVGAREHLLDFAQYTWPGYERAPHLELVAQELEDIEAGRNDRLMVFMPPRHSKSETISVRFPAWYLCRHPERKVIAATHREDLTGDSGRQVRNILRSQKLFPRAQLTDDSRARDFWHTTEGGQYLGVGVGSGVVGFGADLILVDDPHGKAGEVASETQRDHAWTWWTTELWNRREPGCAIVVIMHRWHEDDLAGRILASQPGRWRVVRLPLLAEAEDALGRAPGAMLWPGRYSEAEIEETRQVVGEREWNAKYQQRPAPEEGAIFRWWPTYQELPRLNRIIVGLDTAYTGEQGSDYTAYTAWGLDGARAYWLDAEHYRGETPEAMRRVTAFVWKMQQQHPGARVQTGVRSSVAIDRINAQTLRAGVPILSARNGGAFRETRAGLDVCEVKLPRMGGSKVTEELAALVSVYFEGGRALLPASPDPALAERLRAWKQEHLVCPTGQHDDFVETTVICLWYAFRRGEVVRRAPRALYGDGA